MVGLGLMSETSTNIKVVNSISELSREEWDKCAIFHSDDDSMKQQIHLHAMTFYMHLKKWVRWRRHWLDPYHLAAFNNNKFVGAVPLFKIKFTGRIYI